MAEGESADIAAAVKILREGGLVAFPTETVYGLGADATQSAAVRKIFAAKGRPGTNPLIVHVADISAARRYARVWPKEAEVLAAAFWPGALTLVVPKSAEIVDEVTAGLGSVGLRVPNHPMALELLRGFGGAVAAPSANRSGRVSPTAAEHVRKELAERVDLILDGGACGIGIESTVIDLSGQRPTVLRPGGVSQTEIEALIGAVRMVSVAADGRTAMASPGMSAVHYSPATPMYRVEFGRIEQVRRWCAENPGKPAVILALNSIDAAGNEVVAMPNDPAEYARRLYGVLHAADAQNAAAIWVEMPPDMPAWAAVRDRLRRASTAGIDRNLSDPVQGRMKGRIRGR